MKMAKQRQQSIVDQITSRRAFPDAATPLVSHGASYLEICLKYVSEEFHAQRVYILASGSLSKSTSLVTDLEAALGSRFAATRIGMSQHTLMNEVLYLVQEAQNLRADCIVTMGGESFTDAAKILSFALANNATTEQALERLPHVGAENLSASPSAIPIISIPSTLSGSEYSVYAGAINSSSQKFTFCSPLTAPSLVIWSSPVTACTPLKLWLQSGFRAVDHCIESLSQVSITPELEEAGYTGLKLLIPGLIKSHDDQQNSVSRFSCQMGSMHSMLPFHRFHPVGASHGITHVLGPLCGVESGEASCILLPTVCKYNARVGSKIVLQRQKRIRDLIWSLPDAKHVFKAHSLSQKGADLADLLDALVIYLELPTSLGEVGVGRRDFDMLAKKSLADPYLATNAVPITTKDEVLKILELCA